MRRINQYARFLCYFAGITFLAACTVAVIHLDGFIIRQDIMLTNTERNLNAKLDHLDEVTTKLSTATDQQTRYWAAITRDTRINLVNSNKAIQSLNHLIQTTDSEVNGKLLPQIEASVARNDQRIGESVQALDVSLQNLSEASRRASDLLGDPNLKKGIENASQATLEAKGWNAEAHRAAKDAADTLHETLHPKRPSIALRLLFWALGRGFEASVTGATHGAVGH